MSEAQSSASPEELNIQRSRWLAEIFTENPDLLELRENALPWTGGTSFSDILDAKYSASRTQFNRFTILELLYQHLKSIGYDKTASTLRTETGHRFQEDDQPWDRTKLRLLLSLGYNQYNETPWSINPDPNVNFLSEDFDEDSLASTYTEELTDINPENFISQNSYTLDKNVPPNTPPTLKNISTATLVQLLSLILFSESQLITETDKQGFLLILQSITSSHHFLTHILHLYNKLSSNITRQSQIVNFLSSWVIFMGQNLGRRTLNDLRFFFELLSPSIISQCNSDNLQKALKLIKSDFISEEKPEPNEAPMIKRSQYSLLFSPKLSIFDPEPFEVASQISLISYSVYSQIPPREIYSYYLDRSSTFMTPRLSSFFELQNNIARHFICGLVGAQSSERILVIQKFEKLFQALDFRGNYATISAVLRQLRLYGLTVLVDGLQRDGSLFSGGHRFVERERENPEGVENTEGAENVEGEEGILNDNVEEGEQTQTSRWGKDKNNEMSIAGGLITEDQARVSIKSVCGEDGTRANYDAEIRRRIDEKLPAIPNIIRDAETRKIQKTPKMIGGLINWGGRKELAQVMAIHYRFQKTPYLLWDVVQIQNMLKKTPSIPQDELVSRINDVRSALVK